MIYTLTGRNDFLLAQKLRQLTQNFIQTHGDYELERIEGREVDFQHIRERLESLPFLAEKKCIVLDQPGKNTDFLAGYEQVLPGVSEAVDVLLVEPQLDKRTSYAKFIKKHTEYLEFNALDEARLVNWVQAEVKRVGASMSASDARFLVQRVGLDQHRLHNEVEKLAAYDSAISRITIELLCEPTPQSSIFELMDAAFAGNVVRALSLYDDQRAQKVEPQLILGMMVRQLHIIALVATAPPALSKETIGKDAGLHPFAVQKSQAAAQKLGLARIRTYISELRDLDRLQKTKPINLDEAMHYFIIHLSDKA